MLSKWPTTTLTHLRWLNNLPRLLYLAVIAAIGFACNDVHTELQDSAIKIKIPAHFPDIIYPEDNTPTTLRIELGRRLFYDTRLSSENDINCATCHVQSAAFTDGKRISTAASSSDFGRNSPTLANLAWAPVLMAEGGVISLELQALAPLHNNLEMGDNMMPVVENLNRDKNIRRLAKAAYNRDSVDPFVVTRALAAFQRTLISGDTRYDRYRNNQSADFTESEIRGMEIFFSEKTNCGSCHSGTFFTDYEFYNIGLYEQYADIGRERKTHLAEDNGKFKTPTLRNIALTGPYMHDGSLSTLQEVIDFYNGGGHNHPNKDNKISELNLSESEQNDLIAFLNTLTDWNFVQNKNFSSPEVE